MSPVQCQLVVPPKLLLGFPRLCQLGFPVVSRPLGRLHLHPHNRLRYPVQNQQNNRQLNHLVSQQSSHRPNHPGSQAVHHPANHLRNQRVYQLENPHRFPLCDRVDSQVSGHRVVQVVNRQNNHLTSLQASHQVNLHNDQLRSQQANPREIPQDNQVHNRLACLLQFLLYLHLQFQVLSLVDNHHHNQVMNQLHNQVANLPAILL